MLKNNTEFNNNLGLVVAKYQYIIAIGLFLVHLLFKSKDMAFISFWFDEAYSVYWAGHSVSEIIEESLKNDPNPPLYCILLHYWIQIFGDSEYGVRLFSAAMSALAGSALFLFALRFFNWQTAIFSSMMYCTANEMYFYGIEARTFSIVILFSIFSYYSFLCLLKEPKIWRAFLLGILNAALIYLHLLAIFVILGEIILFPLLALRLLSPVDRLDKQNLKFIISKKTLLLFIGSLMILGILLYPWLERLLGYSQNGIKNFWLAKPTYRVFKDCLYDFFNTKTLFNIYTISAVFVFITVVLFKKLRVYPISKKLFVFALIMGPGLILLNYFLAGYIPIFLKRYVLFTFIGFILLYCYIYSLLRLNFFIKLAAFAVLSFFSFKAITYPRLSFFDYDKAIVSLKRVQEKNTFITNNCQDLFSYYYDKKLFYIKEYHVKHDSLLARGIYTPYDLSWPITTDLSKYKMVYYSHTFEYISDPERKVANALRRKLKLIAEISIFKGIQIECYYNPYYLQPESAKETINRLKEQIKANQEWYDQVVAKAKNINISIDSMLTLDACWMYERQAGFK